MRRTRPGHKALQRGFAIARYHRPAQKLTFALGGAGLEVTQRAQALLDLLDLLVAIFGSIGCGRGDRALWSGGGNALGMARYHVTQCITDELSHQLGPAPSMSCPMRS